MGVVQHIWRKPGKFNRAGPGASFYIFLGLLWFVFHPLSSQSIAGETGFFPIENYTHEVYNAHHQNWFITQDQNGFIYSGNGLGILEFDGDSWRLISSRGLQAVRTVVVDVNNRKWVGADRELGYLEADSLGFLQFKSLKHKIPAGYELTGNIWQIFPEGNRILFFTDRTIYCWEDGEFRIIPVPGNIYREYQIHGTVYVDITGMGMYLLVGDSLKLIQDGELFAENGAVIAIPYDSSSVLFATRAPGIYVYDTNSVSKLENQVEDYLYANNLYAARRLPDSTYAFATMRGGIALMDKNGNWLGAVTEESGLQNNQVHGLTVDREHALWTALQTGISKVSLLRPYQHFDKRSGIEGTVSAITRHKGRLYVGTSTGLFALEQGSGTAPSKFIRIQGIESGCFALLSTQGELFAATANGTFRIDGQEVEELNRLAGCRTLYPSGRDPNRVYVGHMHGLSTIYKSNGRWGAEKDLEQLKEDIFSITSDASGKLWLGTSLNKVISVDIPLKNRQGVIADFDQAVVQDHSKGLPKGSATVFLIDGSLYVVTNDTQAPFFEYDTAGGRFVPNTDFGTKFGLDSLSIYPIAYQEDGKFLMLESAGVEGIKHHFSAIRDKNGNYSVQRVYDEEFRSTTETRIYWDEDNLLWIGGEMITKYDLGNSFNFQQPFNTHIRKVTAGQDSTIFGGVLSVGRETLLPYRNGGLRFEYSATSLAKPESNRYQYRLEGFEDGWSDWSSESRKDYTNLPEGNYRFMARAQNLYGVVGNTGNYEFVILTPWYRSLWAYIGYTAFILLLLWGLLQWRARQLIAKNEALEQIVAMRTAEVQHQANQLRIQAEKLQELDKSKSRFFANISHEFRTPLTLIKGPIEHLEQHSGTNLSLDTIKMIRRNANRLLQMVNQLLDLSKIDEGSLKLTFTEGDVFKCLRAATSSFNSHAAQRNIDYKVQIPQGSLWASFDRDKLENILYNLLGNAFKFSEDNSSISFLASCGKTTLQLVVTDTGKGIPEEKLPLIFERFYQADDRTTRDKEGSGIGLSLSRDLIKLMGGSINVTSEVGKGTIFTVQFPLEEIKTRQRSEAEEPQLPPPPFPKMAFELSRTDRRQLPNILLVEDNADMRQFIKERLLLNYRVTEAENGEKGLKMALKNPPDLIVTDLMMPRMDGIEFCKLIKTDLLTSHIPVIMLTAKAGRENKIEGLETGADDYLTKPFDGKELLVRIKNLIEQRQRLRELFGQRDTKVNPGEITVTSLDQRFLEQLLALLEAEHTDPGFGVPQMQRALAMSKTQLHRKLKSLTNESPSELLRNFRLKRAAQLLRQQEDSITRIAYKVGFNNLSYFAKCFKELYGQSPSSY